MLARVRYQVATYSGVVIVSCDPDEETETVCARAREQLRRRSGGSLPFGAESFHEIERVGEVLP